MDLETGRVRDGKALRHDESDALMPLVLRRASASRPSGSWSVDDYDVLDGERVVGRIYLVTDHPGSPWFWGVSFELSGRKGHGHADSLDEAKAEEAPGEQKTSTLTAH